VLAQRFGITVLSSTATPSIAPPQPSTSAHQAAGRHWDRLPVPGEDFLKRRLTKNKARFRSATFGHVLRNRALRRPDAASSHRDRQPIMATTFRSASPPESKLSSVLTHATKLHSGVQRPPGGAVLPKKSGHLPYP